MHLLIKYTIKKAVDIHLDVALIVFVEQWVLIMTLVWQTGLSEWNLELLIWFCSIQVNNQLLSLFDKPIYFQ